MDKQIENCPFCANDIPTVSVTEGVHFKHFHVLCTDCGCRTRYFNTAEEAITAWSTRTTPTPPAGQTATEQVQPDTKLNLLPAG